LLIREKVKAIAVGTRKRDDTSIHEDCWHQKSQHFDMREGSRTEGSRTEGSRTEGSRTEGNDGREGRTRRERMQNIARKEAQGKGDLTRESKRNIAATTPPKTLFQ
jgi:hypothetical protein